jgi:hypothetical protein
MVGLTDRVPCGEIREEGPYGAVLLGCTRADPRRRFKTVSAVRDILLSLEIAPVSSVLNEKTGTLAAQLDSTNPFSESAWVSLIDFVDHKYGTPDAKAVFLRLSQTRIAEICNHFPDHARKLGLLYARWVHDASFDFESCDGIANRLQVFVQSCPLDVKADCHLALLELGTSHNRWYVERMFMGLCGAEMEENFARRMAVELKVVGSTICRSISQLERSIGAKREMFHPILIEALEELCQ